MRHKLLFTCAFICLLGSASTRASSETTKDYRMAAALQALFAVGVRYHYGGNSPDTGFDCSGLVHYVFLQYGINLPRIVEEQWQVGDKVKPSEIKPGDLLFFSTKGPGATHVAIAVDSGHFVHAPNSTGVVRVEALSSSYWGSHYIGAKRIGTSSASN